MSTCSGCAAEPGLKNGAGIFVFVWHDYSDFLGLELFFSSLHYHSSNPRSINLDDQLLDTLILREPFSLLLRGLLIENAFRSHDNFSFRLR